MSLAEKMFPNVSGGENFLNRTQTATAIVGEATNLAMLFPAEVWRKLNQRGSDGRAEGTVAVMRDMLVLRIRKSIHPYRVRRA